FPPSSPFDSGTQLTAINYSLRFLDHEQMTGSQVAKRLLHAGGPGDFDDVGCGGMGKTEMQAEVVLRIVARTASDLVYLAVPAARHLHASADGRSIRARSHTLDQYRPIATLVVIAQQRRWS